MRGAYALYGLGILILLLGAWYALGRKEAEAPITSTSFIPMTSPTLILTSPAFENGGVIPSTYTCDDRRDLNPALSWSGIPAGTVSLALIMDDPDVPKAVKPDGVFDHWTLFNIPPAVSGIPEGGSAGTPGANGAGRNAYTGPCPPPQYEPSEHRYFFRLYALDAELPLQTGASKEEVLAAMEGHIIGQGELMGRYKRR